MKVNLTKLFHATVIIVLLITTISCSNNSASSTSNSPETGQVFKTPGAYTAYTAVNRLFSVSYPKQWERLSINPAIYQDPEDVYNNMKTGGPVNGLMFMAGIKNTPMVSPALSIAIHDNFSGVSNIEQAVDAEMKDTRQSDPDYQEISKNKTVVSGKDAMIIEYKESSKVGGLYHSLDLVVLSGNYTWFLDCSTTEDTFSQWVKDFSNVIGSFQIIN